MPISWRQQWQVGPKPVQKLNSLWLLFSYSGSFPKRLAIMLLNHAPKPQIVLDRAGPTGLNSLHNHDLARSLICNS